MVSVDINTTVAEFERRRDDMQALEKALDSLASDYNASITSINNTISNITFDYWEDAISTILKTVVETMKTHVDTISKDISGGGFAALQKTSANLAKQLDACAKEKDRLEKQKDKLKETDEYIPSGNTTIKNPVYTNIENNIAILENSLQAKVNICNQLFELLTTIEFNPKTPYQVPDVDVEVVNLSDATPPGDDVISPRGDGTLPGGDGTSPGGDGTQPSDNSKKWSVGAFISDLGIGVLKVVEGFGGAAENIIDGVSLLFNWSSDADVRQSVIDRVKKDTVGSLFQGAYDSLDQTAYWGSKGVWATGAERLGNCIGYAGLAYAGGAIVGAAAGAAGAASAAGTAAATGWTAVGIATAGGLGAGATEGYATTGNFSAGTTLGRGIQHGVGQWLFGRSLRVGGQAVNRFRNSTGSLPERTRATFAPGRVTAGGASTSVSSSGGASTSVSASTSSVGTSAGGLPSGGAASVSSSGGAASVSPSGSVPTSVSASTSSVGTSVGGLPSGGAPVSEAEFDHAYRVLFGDLHGTATGEDLRKAASIWRLVADYTKP